MSFVSAAEVSVGTTLPKRVGSGDPDANNLFPETEKGGGDAANAENGARTVDAGPAAALLPSGAAHFAVARGAGPGCSVRQAPECQPRCRWPWLGSGRSHRSASLDPFLLPCPGPPGAESQSALIKAWGLSSPAESKRVGFWFHTLAVPRSRLLAGDGSSSWGGGGGRGCTPEADGTPRERVGVLHPRVQSQSLFP